MSLCLSLIAVSPLADGIKNGLGWVVGAVAAGLLYEQSQVALVAYAAGVQLTALPLFVLAHRRS